MTELRYPVGEQDFAKIRTQNLVYVDKTEVLYRLVTTRSYYFLSRPRRFGKSLMLSTLRYYFEGRRELFQGLAMERLEQQWTVHPVIYLDMSSEKYAEVANLHSAISRMLERYEQRYHVDVKDSDTYGTRLGRIIEAAHEATGQGVVVLIDEYDAPMLDATGDEAKMEVMRNITRSLYSPLKARAAQLRFVMLTGITKFSQLSIFSELNNLSNISMEPDYEAICGITEREMLTQLRPGIEQMAQHTGVTMDECVAQLKEYYDGYHFSEELTDIYNPYSLLSALASRRLGLHWFGTGRPTWLLNLIKHYRFDITEMECIPTSASRFDKPAQQITDVVPVLYQSGYLTIKDYDDGIYFLGIPNREVRTGLGESLTEYTDIEPIERKDYLRLAYRKLVRHGDLDGFMSRLTDFLHSIPYDTTVASEKHYQSVLYAVLASFGADVMAEDRTSDGRAD
ncbi:MAG: AAA family ATPase, partial [Muribaculaceae bacterium]|nr:AAA family ATPase [Muribaculaceae bacterium]